MEQLLHKANEIIVNPSMAIDADDLLQTLRQVLKLNSEVHADLIANFCGACIIHYQKEIASNLEQADSYYNLGNIYAELNQDEEAFNYYHQSLQLNSSHSKAYFSLGNLAMKQGKDTEAIANFLHSIQLNPDFVKPYINLAFLYDKQEKLEESLVNLRKAVEIDPDFAIVHKNLGCLMVKLDRLDEAINYLQKAIDIDPNYVEAFSSLAETFAKQGKMEEALANYQAVLCGQEKRTQTAHAYHQQHLILPGLYENEVEIELWRQRFTLGLQTLSQEISLETESDRLWALSMISFDVNFYLAYQGRNDLELQKQYGSLVHRIMVASYPKFSEQPSSPLSIESNQESHKIRIGYLSSCFKMHSVAKVTIGWLKYRDKSNFEVYTYYTGEEVDFLTREFERESDVFRHILNNPDNVDNFDDIEAICTQVIADQLDVLIFAEIGLFSQTTKIAALRLAPIQICGFGHPITSGLPTIDYFLSSETMESDQAQSHYSEQLVCLPKIGISYPKIAIPIPDKKRADFGLPEDAVVYSCCQSLFKYLPQHDYIFAEIAKRVPNSKFVFYPHFLGPYLTEKFRQRLHLAFANLDLDADRYCVILPRTGRRDFLDQTLASDVYLDSLEFSGANTTLEAIACNLPVVTLPGQFVRGRLSYGMLKVMDVTDTIAQTEAEYIEIAVRLGLDLPWRQSIVEKIQSQQDVLFEDQTCVRAFEEFLKSKVKRTIAPSPERIAETHNKLGVTFAMQGKLEDAIASFQVAIAINPESADAHYNLGLTLAEQKSIEEAIISFRRVLDINPEHIDANLNLSTLLLKQKKLDEAIACLQDLLAIQPDCADAYFNLSSAFLEQENHDEALVCLEEAIAIQPDYVEAYVRLGNILCTQGFLDEAITCFLKVVEIQPDYMEAHVNLGNILCTQNKFDQAIICFLKAVKIEPNYADGHFQLGNTLLHQTRLDEAILSCQTAIELSPNDSRAYIICGIALSALGRTQESLNYFQKVLEIEPDHPIAYRMQQMILPIIYRTESEITWWRQSFTQGLENLIARVSLDTEESRKWSLEAVLGVNNFHLTYQGMNDVELQSQYGQLAHRVMSANFPQWAQAPEVNRQKLESNQTSNSAQARKKMRIGYLSNHFCNHSVAKAILGWVEQCDLNSFEIYCYYMGSVIDNITERFEAKGTMSHHVNHSTEEICKQIVADHLDILVFADIGMHPQTTQIASLRLAPVQCTCWGHPVTSGLPTIDYYLSSDLMEPEDHEIAQSHYTEKLVRLPKLGVSFSKPALPKFRKSRADFHLSEHRVLYLCSQSLFKYLPQYDHIFALIAQRVPQAQFVFVTTPRKGYIFDQFSLRLQNAFAKFDLDSHQHCVILPLKMDDYLNANLFADVFLDTIGFSGGCTTFDAIACNLPIVTLPGEFMRGRHSYAMLKVLDIDETIAYNEDEYIEIAVRLGLDSSWRQAIVERMAKYQDNLYEDKTCVAALEDFFRSLSRLGSS
jgi:protein O-GlcNAc transferase